MLRDAKDGYVIIPVGVTLDLQDSTLEATYVIGFNGSKLTGITAGEAKLKVAENALVLSAHATSGIFSTIPVWNGSYYELALVCMRDSLDGHGLTVEGDTIRFKFRNVVEPYYRNYLLNDGGDDNGINVVVELSWQGEKGRASQTFTYNKDSVGEVCANIDVDYYFTLTGFSALDIDLDTLEIRGKMIVDCGIELTTRTFNP